VTAPNPRRRAAVRFIVLLGVVSLFADMTYEGAYSILGPFLKDLGATALEVGLISGFGEMLAASLRYFSGRFADRSRAYWAIVYVGYGVNVLAIPLLAFAGSWKIAALLVVAERTGKALRGPARDVLLSDATKEVGHGFGFGIHSAMDQTGAVIGPLLMVWMVAKMHAFGPAFLPLGIPAVLTLVALTFAQRAHPSKGEPPATPPRDQKLPPVFWVYVAAAGMLACGFVDFPLLAFHYQNTGLVKPQVIPLLYAGAMGLTGATALVFGRLFDRFGVVMVVVGTLISLLTLPLGFLGTSLTTAALAAACWAIGLGAQDAVLRAGIAQVVSMNKRGSAFGAFNGVYGVMWFLGSATMGLLYSHSLVSLVVFGVVCQIIAGVVFMTLRGPLAKAAA
jgi:MFS family permease